MKRRNVETLKRRSPIAAPLTARRRSRHGMALVDVILGALMLGLGLAVILSLGSRSLASQTDGEKRMVAAWLADELLTMVLVEGPDEYSYLYDMEGEFYEPFEEFFYEVDIRDNGIGVPYGVTATVWWQGPRGLREVRLEAAIAARGGDPEQLREPRERVDRETRHYERLFGEEEPDPRAGRVPTNTPGTGAGGSGGRGRGPGRDVPLDATRGGRGGR